MSKYKKRPVIIEAEQWFPGKKIEGVIETTSTVGIYGGLVMGPKERIGEYEMILGLIETLEGTMFVRPGDYIITGIRGERYPCKPEIFEETYEIVNDVKSE